MESKDRYDLLLDAIEEERKEEEHYYKNLLSQKTIKEKTKAGVLWYPCAFSASHYTVGEQVEIALELPIERLGPHKLKSGKGVHIFITDEDQVFNGVITFLRKNKIRILIYNAENAHSFNEYRKYGVELIYDERPYQVMRAAMHDLKNSKLDHIVALRKGINNLDSFTSKPNPSTEFYNNPQLNTFQNEAVSKIAFAHPISIIHGPPGTGKTTTLVALIKYLVKTEKKILVCASSNNAVDLLSILLSEQKVNVLRIGNISRMGDQTAALSLREKLTNHPDWGHIKKVKIEAAAAKKQAGKFKRTFGHKERTDRKLMYQEFKDLRKWARDLEDKLVDKIIDEAAVISSTLIGVSNKNIENILFDTVIIDEASQALEPECWNAILKAKRVVLAGDHLQLPPTVKNNKASQMGLHKTLLDRMTKVIQHSYLLQEQYRMNDEILSFSNKMFYENKLFSNSICKERKIENTISPLVFIDTSGCGFDEKLNPESRSLTNEGEAFILREHFIKQKENFTNHSIGIISPYAEQVRFLKDMVIENELFRKMDITVNTIDGFQGQEKDIIYISLVRSNDQNEIGFLKDSRRLNVAMTRARMQLIMIGDGATLSNYDLYDGLLQHVEKKGNYQSAWEYMT